MNKRNTRWISLVLSLAVMIGSIAYIAADANAEEDPATPTYLLMDTDHVSKLRELANIASTNPDEMGELVSPAPTDGSRRFVYSTVLREDDNDLVDNGTKDLDVYFDLFPNDGKTSIEDGEEVVLTATMENSTCTKDYNNITEYAADNSAHFPDAVDITEFSFDLKYNEDNLTFNAEKSGANIPMKFTPSGTGANAKITVTYPQDSTGGDPIKSYEMVYFTFTFIAKSTSSTVSAEAAIDKSSISVKPASLSVDADDPVDYTIYPRGGNNTLKNLGVTYSVPVSQGANTSLSPMEGILTPDFEPEITNYFVTLPSDATITDISECIECTAANSNAETTVVLNDGTNTLKSGLNRIEITVKPSSGTEKTYTIFAKKLTTDTLADPKTVLTKTVDYKEDGFEYTEEGTSTKKYADFQVQYTIDGVNDLLAPGNGYVISFTPSETDEAEEIFFYIVEHTANLDDSVVELEMQLDDGKFVTYEIDGIGDPEVLANITSTLNGMATQTGTADSQAISNIQQADTTHDFNNIYVIETSDVPIKATASTSYSVFELDGTNTLDNFKIDNTVAEFVIIADYSSGVDAFNRAVTFAMFGYPARSTSGDPGIPGYIKQVKDMLTNDSTAKVTLIALGAAGNEPDDDILDTVNFDYGIQINRPAIDGVEEGSEPQKENNVYQSQTYILPLADSNLWGNTAGGTAVVSEQNNFDNYRDSFNSRQKPGTAIVGEYERTTAAGSATSPTLAGEYDTAITEANAILDGANNPHLIIITPKNKNDINAMIRASSSGAPGTHLMQAAVATGIDTTIISGTTLTNQTDADATAKNLYNQIVVNDPGSFICDPGDNTETTHLRDTLNSRIFQNVYGDGSTAVVNADTIRADIEDDTPYCYDIKWYKPAIGDYELHGKYLAVRVDGSDSKLLEDHYYPLSDTVDTKVKGASDSVEKDDIPTVALKYNETYSLDVVKGVTDFKDIGGAEPDKSTITYVVTYENTGEKNLNNVNITDSLVMMSAAADRKVYKLGEGKTVPAATDTPLAVTFTSSNDLTHPNKGEARVADSLAPGEKIYLTYKITIPEYTGVTTGTTSKDSSNNTIYSYIIDNIATGTANELDRAAEVELKTDFRYSKSSGGTTPTSTSSTSSTTSSTTIHVYPYNPNPSTGESRVGYVIAVSLLFGALGVFGVTIYGMIIDYKIEKARRAKYLSR